MRALHDTAQIAPTMPIVIQRNKVFITLLGLAVNSEFKYPNYFSMIPVGPDPKSAFTKGFFDIAMSQSPKPQTVAIMAADQEFSSNAADGARENAQKVGLKILYDKTHSTLGQHVRCFPDPSGSCATDYERPTSGWH